MKSRTLIAMALFTGGAALAGLSGSASAVPAIDAIQSPIAATVTIGGTTAGSSITDTFNHNGLFSDGIDVCTPNGCGPDFTNGEDFNTYIALDPQHTPTFSGYEWFSDLGATSAQVIYDMGSTMTIDALALWNEESSGIGSLNLFWSTNNVDYFPIGGGQGLQPTNWHDTNATYGADVFDLASTPARYIRFDISGCPQPGAEAAPFCAIGEVAFAVGPGAAVPEPATLALLGLGLAGLGIGRRKRQ